MNSSAHEKVRKLLAKNYVGYVLVTCKSPSHEGDMDVEMSFDGDPVLAAYLMEGAQVYLDEKTDNDLSKNLITDPGSSA